MKCGGQHCLSRSLRCPRLAGMVCRHASSGSPHTRACYHSCGVRQQVTVSISLSRSMLGHSSTMSHTHLSDTLPDTCAPPQLAGARQLVAEGAGGCQNRPSAAARARRPPELGGRDGGLRRGHGADRLSRRPHPHRRHPAQRAAGRGRRARAGAPVTCPNPYPPPRPLPRRPPMSSRPAWAPLQAAQG